MNLYHIKSKDIVMSNHDPKSYNFFVFANNFEEARPIAIERFKLMQADAQKGLDKWAAVFSNKVFDTEIELIKELLNIPLDVIKDATQGDFIIKKIEEKVSPLIVGKEEPWDSDFSTLDAELGKLADQLGELL